MGKGRVASFASGFSMALASGLRQKALDEEAKADRAMVREERQIGLDNTRREAATRDAVAAEARPVQVEEGAGGMIRPATMDNRDVGLPENTELPNQGLALSGFRAAGQEYGTRPEAEAAATAFNTPEAVTMRQAGALRAGGKPSEALSLENAVSSQKQGKLKFTREQQDYAKKLKDEGVLEGVAALRRGDARSMVEAFNRSGAYKIDGEPVISTEERDVPGVGKVPTYTATLNLVGADGQVKPMKINSHDLSMQLMPYEKALESQRKGVASDDKAAYQQGMLENKIKQLELTGQIAEAKLLARVASGAGGGPNAKLAEADRKRFTELSREATRDVDTAEKTLNTLRKDIVFMSKAKQPGTPEAEELAQARDKIKRSTEDRELYRGLLVDPTPERKAALSESKSGAKPAAARGATPAEPKSKAEYDKLDKGSRYRHPDGTVKIKN